jgi:hypothetical protein
MMKPTPARLALFALLCTLGSSARLQAAPRLSHGARTRNLPDREFSCGTGAPFAPVSQPRLTYCGGRVLSQAQIVAVLWGPPDPLVPTPSCAAPTFQGCLDNYYRQLVASPQFDWIDEYQTTLPGADGTPGTQQHIGRPTYWGSVVITPANHSPVVGEVDTEAELVSQIQAGNLPAPDAADETIYEVHFPLGVDPSDACSIACGNFCAYHDSWRSNILNTNGLLAIIPSHMPPGYHGGRQCNLCGSRTDWFANLGDSISHETFETITDPDVGLVTSQGCAAPLGWYDEQGEDPLNVHGEIGDMCEGLPDGTSEVTGVSFPGTDGGSYTVQREWSNARDACIGSINDAFTIVAPAGPLLDAPGGDVTFLISTTAPLDAGPVPLKLTAHGLPATGVTARFSPTTIDASGTSTLTLSVAADARQTSFSFGVVGDSGDTLAETLLTVAPPDFSASTDRSSLALTAGGAGVTMRLSTAALSGAGRGFALSTSGAPGVLVSPAAGTLGAPLSITLSAAAGAPTVDGILSLNVTSAGLTHTLPLQLSLSGDDAALSATTIPVQSAQQGHTTQIALASSTKSGKPQTLFLSAINQPRGVTASFSPATILSGESATCALSVPDSQALGPVTITLIGVGPYAQASFNLPLNVVAASGCAEPGAPLFALLGLVALTASRRRGGGTSRSPSAAGRRASH